MEIGILLLLLLVLSGRRSRLDELSFPDFDTSPPDTASHEGQSDFSHDDGGDA